MFSQRTTTEIRREEKQDMVRLNDKLAGYVQRVRNLGASGADSAAFLDALRSIEEEVSRLKAMYENELESLRRKLDESNKLKNEALSAAEKNRRVAADFEDRFQSETGKNAQMMNDLRVMQGRIAELERELAQARSSAAAPQAQLNAAQNDLARETAKNAELARALDQERANTKQLQDKLKSLQQNLGFNDQRNNEQLKDASNRLDQSKKVITDLEQRARDLERQNASLPELLDQMRRKTEQDLANYKKEVESANARNNATMKKQLDDQDRTLKQLKANNAKLEKENADLQNKVRSLEAQVRDLMNQKTTLENQLAQERTRSSDQVRALEQKLKELQDVLFSKMQEVNAGKDVQVSLRAEIEAMRVLLEDEERRLGNLAAGRNATGTGSYGYANNMTSSSYNSAAIPKPNVNGYGDHKAALDKTNAGRMTSPQRGGRKVMSKDKELEKRTEYQFSYNRGGPVPAWAKTRTSLDTFPKLSTETNGRCTTPAVRQSMQRAY